MPDPGIPSEQCLNCAHYRGADFDVEHTDSGSRMMAWLACDAFPKGIPEKIRTGQHDHRLPFKGDRGVRYTPRIDSPGEGGGST
jgi:hypothetical protein